MQEPCWGAPGVAVPRSILTRYNQIRWKLVNKAQRFKTDACVKALQLIGTVGGMLAHPDQFADMYIAGVCPACHCSMHSLQTICPCPHLLTRVVKNSHRLDDVFGMFGLGGVLHFLISCIHAEQRRGNPPAEISVDGDVQQPVLRLRLRDRSWSFQVVAGGQGGDLLRFDMHHRRARSPAPFFFDPWGGDAHLLRRFGDSVWDSGQDGASA